MNINEYNLGKKRKKMFRIVVDMIADIIDNKKLNSILNELFVREKKLKISIVFITQSYFKVPKDVFIVKIPNKRELHQIVLNQLSGIDFKDFVKIYK